MKRHVQFILMFCLVLSSHASDNNSNPVIRVMTFNIRVNVPSDGVNAWPNRKDMAAGMIRFHHADIVGIQEALVGQVHDLAERLPNYNWFGVGRDDGKKQGEFMAIFYLKERFEVLEDSTFWLSEHPETPGKGWDAACNRVVTWGQFMDHKTDKRLYLFNTHFDHRGETARQESAKLLLRSIKQLTEGACAVVTGDFNSTPQSIPYKIMTWNFNAESVSSLHDAKTVSVHPHHGPNRTFTGFDLSKLMETAPPIDYIFVTDQIKVLNHGTLSDTFDGFLPSDHMPVVIDICFKESQ